MAKNNSNSISPFVVGISGHRDLHPAALQQLRVSITEILQALARRLPDSELRIMSGMAAGADLLVVQTALELGFSVDALLPMPLEQFAMDFDPGSFALLKSLMAHPNLDCRELPLSSAESAADIPADGPGRDARYVMVAQSLIRGCSLLIALWNGQPSPLPAGTADTVLRYLGVRTDRNKDDERLEFTDAPPEQYTPARLVYWIPAPRADGSAVTHTTSPCYLAGLGDNSLLRLPAMPRRLDVHLSSLNIYNREFQRFKSGWPAPGPADSLIRALPPGLAVDPLEKPILERIDAQYGKADALALYFQRRSDRLFAFFNLVAFAMGLAYLVYEKFMSTRVLLFAYLLILTTSAAVYHLLHQRHWFAKHLMCRALAETLRVKFYLRLAHGDQLVDAEEVLSLSGINSFHGFGWIGHVLTGVEAPPTSAEPERGADVTGVDDAWIENQRKYFVRKVAKLHQSAVRTKWLKRTLLGVIVAVVLILLLLGEESIGGQVAGMSLDNALTFIMGLVAVTLASWELHQNKMASRELLWQYRSQLKHFSRARAQLARTVAFGRRLEILAELGKDSLMESYLWTIQGRGRYARAFENLILALIVVSVASIGVAEIPGLPDWALKALRASEVVIVAVFTFEYVLRMIAASTRRPAYCATPMAGTTLPTYGARRGRSSLSTAPVSPEGVTVTIEDDGPPFDPLSLPPPELNVSLEERRVGGLGVFLVRQMMDSVDYARVKGRNQLRMSKRHVG